MQGRRTRGMTLIVSHRHLDVEPAATIPAGIATMRAVHCDPVFLHNQVDSPMFEILIIRNSILVAFGLEGAMGLLKLTAYGRRYSH